MWKLAQLPPDLSKPVLRNRMPPATPGRAEALGRHWSFPSRGPPRPCPSRLGSRRPLGAAGEQQILGKVPGHQAMPGWDFMLTAPLMGGQGEGAGATGWGWGFGDPSLPPLKARREGCFSWLSPSTCRLPLCVWGGESPSFPGPAAKPWAVPERAGLPWGPPAPLPFRG